jgi:cell fate regulator YaaT (PSP1 superfamily)
MGCKGCTVCSTSSSNGKAKGCNSNGCASGGCNRLNTFDWLAAMDVDDAQPYDVVEVSFKNGARKAFYRNPPFTRAVTGDMVVIETGAGSDVGRISLSGELVRMQMRKKSVKEKEVLHNVIRVANERDLERLEEARQLELPTMVRARVIARTLGLNMKVGDVEYQADKRKATFFYTADGRVDFRELIRQYAKEFRVKIEMRQIGARQESARIGGIGSCGRELCCSTWLTDFRSVTTGAARYQNLAINQAKLSGMCGRLKCCLNYELDTYLDALEHFPRHADKLQTQAGRAVLVKTDIFKRLMYYAYEGENGRGKLFALDAAVVRQMLEMNKKGEKPSDLLSLQAVVESDEEPDMDFEDVTGAVELPEEERRKKRRKKKKPLASRSKDQTRGPADDQSSRPPRKPGGGEGRSRAQGGRSDAKPPRPDQKEGGTPQNPPKEGGEGSSRRSRGRGRRRKR